MTYKLHVLGSGSAFNDTGLANSLHVIKYEEDFMLLDCGPTSLMQLKKYGYDTTKITHIYISHVHGDHFGGLPIMYLEYLHVNPPKQKIKIISPPRFKERFIALQDLLFTGSSEQIDEIFEFHEITDNDEYKDKDVHIKTYPAVHPENPRMAVIQYKGNTKIGYTGDSGLQEQSHQILLREADLALIECMTYIKQIPGHLSFQELQEITPQKHDKPIIIIHASKELHENKDNIKPPYILARDGYEVTLT